MRKTVSRIQRSDFIMLFDSLGGHPQGNGPVSAAGRWGASFSTGGEDLKLWGVKVLVRGVDDEGAFTVSVHTDAGVLPGDIIATTGPISDAVLPTVHQALTVDLPCELAPAARYWVVIAPAEGRSSSLDWAFTQAGVGPGVASEFYAEESSGAWQSYPNSEGGPCQMAVLSRAPEPPVWAVLFGGWPARPKRTPRAA
jgi:hypothetical protein